MQVGNEGAQPTLLGLWRVAERRAEFRRGVGGEAVAHDVFRHDARDEELEQVIAAARFRAAA